MRLRFEGAGINQGLGGGLGHHECPPGDAGAVLQRATIPDSLSHLPLSFPYWNRPQIAAISQTAALIAEAPFTKPQAQGLRIARGCAGASSPCPPRGRLSLPADRALLSRTEHPQRR
jgi:hypothetical protein